MSLLEHANRVDGALSRLVHRGEEGVALIHGWLQLPAHGSDATSHRAYTWLQARQGEALAWLGDADGAQELAAKLRVDSEAHDEFVAMWGNTLLGPLLAALGDPVGGGMRLSLARQLWDRIYDDDVDGYGYGSLFADFLTSAEERVAHLAEQRFLPLASRTWAEPPSGTRCRGKASASGKRSWGEGDSPRSSARRTEAGTP